MQALPGEYSTPLCKIYLDKGVELRGDAASRAIIAQMNEATEEDWHTEYLAPILSVRVVSGLDQAIEHIEVYGSQHTDSIITEDYSRARRFLREVDSSSVMVNASTRFADGFEYGLGAEIGISTDKIHARGPSRAGRIDQPEIYRAGRWANTDLSVPVKQAYSGNPCVDQFDLTMAWISVLFHNI